MNQTAHFSIPSLIVIILAIFLYIIVLYGIILSFLRRKAKKVKVQLSEETDKSLLKYEGPERRLYKRKKLSVDIRYRCYSKSSGVNIFKEGIAVDISEGGIGILLETDEKLGINDKLELKLKLPLSLHFMLIRGNVVWSKELEKEEWYRHGITFIEIDPNDRKLIAKYVEEHKIHPHK